MSAETITSDHRASNNEYQYDYYCHMLFSVATVLFVIFTSYNMKNVLLPIINYNSNPVILQSDNLQ